MDYNFAKKIRTSSRLSKTKQDFQKKQEHTYHHNCGSVSRAKCNATAIQIWALRVHFTLARSVGYWLLTCKKKNWRKGKIG